MAEKKTSKKKTTRSSGSKDSAKAKKPAPKASSKPAKSEEESIASSGDGRVLLGLILLALGVILLISYFSTDGKFVAFFADIFKGLLGRGFWLTVPALLFAGGLLLLRRKEPVTLRVSAALLLPLLLGALTELLAQPAGLKGLGLQALAEKLYVTGKRLESGGALGGLLGEGLDSAFSIYGAFPLLLVGFLLLAVLAVRGRLSGLFTGMKQAAAERREELRQRREQEQEEEEEEEPEEPVQRVKTPERRSAAKTRRPSYSVDLPLGAEEEELSLKGPSASFIPTPPERDPAAKRATVRRKTESAPKVETFRFPEDEPSPFEEQPESRRKLPVSPVPKTPKVPAAPVAMTAEIKDPPGDPPKPKRMGKKELEKETQAVAAEISSAEDKPVYEFPPLELLRSSTGGKVDARDEIQLNGERLQGALNSFGINAAIVGVTHGPTVTRYDIELEQGVKLSRVTNLAGDLALALGVVNVRIAPIPDKISTVGIEVPNKIVSTVYLREIIESPRFQSAKSKLSFALGKDIGGDCIVGNIAKLPHMLIAGTTGSGKSVCMNSLILSLLYKARPDEGRLIMIDPKMVELGVYNGIPHLYVPVVTDPKKAAGALQWSVVEMLKRYRLFSEIGVRDLESYNKHAQVAGEDTLPQVVIVIDELADLMLVASKEVEESICRVAQMGRAAGMHLVIATQRPSADVITGLMKANIPSRIAFAVSSAMESRIILDQGGAEKLVGMGDMLFSPVGSGKPTRIQGAFVSDEEREEVIQFIKDSAGEVQKNSEIEEFMNKATEDKTAAEGAKGAKDEGSSASGYDEMLPQAVEAVIEAGSCSVSMLQRRVKLGYSRAARIVDQMEELGVVGPYEGAKPRAVTMDRAGWHDLQVQLGMIQDDDMALAAEMSENADFAAYDE